MKLVRRKGTIEFFDYDFYELLEAAHPRNLFGSGQSPSRIFQIPSLSLEPIESRSEGILLTERDCVSMGCQVELAKPIKEILRERLRRRPFLIQQILHRLAFGICFVEHREKNFSQRQELVSEKPHALAFSMTAFILERSAHLPADDRYTSHGTDERADALKGTVCRQTLLVMIDRPHEPETDCHGKCESRYCCERLPIQPGIVESFRGHSVPHGTDFAGSPNLKSRAGQTMRALFIRPTCPVGQAGQKMRLKRQLLRAGSDPSGVICET